MLKNSGIEHGSTGAYSQGPRGGEEMTSSATTADLFETEVVEARLVSAKFRLAIEGAKLHLRALYFGRQAATLAEAVIKRLADANNAGAFDSWPDDEFNGLLDDMQKLHAIMSYGILTAQRTGLHAKPLHRQNVARLQSQVERLGDLIETFRLGLNPTFNELVGDAVGKLKASG